MMRVPPTALLLSAFTSLALACSYGLAKPPPGAVTVNASKTEFVIRDGLESGIVPVYLKGGLCVGSSKPTNTTINILTLFASVANRVIDGDQGPTLVNLSRTQQAQTAKAEQTVATILTAAAKGSIASFGADMRWFKSSVTEADLQISEQPTLKLALEGDGEPVFGLLVGCYTTTEFSKLRRHLILAAQALDADLKLPRIDPK